MKRLTKFGAPILLWLIPGAVFALGLGEIHVRSKLNEALDAEIELLYSDPAEPQATEVALASAEDFQRVGLDRSAISARLDFEIVQDASGRYLIRVSSAKPVGDPFVDFLIEVNWPNGRLLREYVVLLDPPVTAPAEVAALSEPEQATAPRPAPRERAPAAEPPAAFDDGGSYEVRRGDTLWEIARDRRPSRDITINQMMMVLYQTNPNAFFRDNINALKAGAVLRLPELEDLERLSVASAISQVRTQNQAWESYRQTWADRTPTVSEAGVSPEYVGREPAAAGADESRLELVPPAADRAAERERAGAELASLRGELSRSREELVAAGQENSELQSRVNELESLVGNLERAITLKDADLADLQNQVELAGVDTTPDAGMGADAAAEASASGEDRGTSLLESELDAAGDVGDDATLAMQDFEDRGGPAGLDEGAGAPVEQTGAADDAAVTPPPPPRQAPGLVEKLAAAVKNPLVMGGLAVALVLGLGGFLWSRRRVEADAGESLVDRMISGGGGVEAEPEAEREAEEELEAVEETRSDESQLIAAIDEQPESAQAHLALLRSYYANDETEKFAAAAARMRDSVGGESHPAWMEVKAMGANLAPDHPLFGAAEEPAGIDDELPDFERSDAAQTVAGAAPDFAAADLELDQPEGEDDDLSLDFELEEGDLPSLDAVAEEPAADSELADDEMSLDFDLGPDIEPSEPEAAGELAAVSGEEAMDLGGEESGDEFGLGLDLDLDESVDEVTPAGGIDDDELPSLDLDDLDLGEATETAPEPTTEDVDTEFDLQEVTSGVEEVDTELDLDLGLDSEGESTTEEQAVDPDQVRKESATLAELESSDEDLGLEDLDLDDKALFGDDDAVGTKLDLAKAYIDMGDPEGARGMLEEVVAEGNPGQKEEAEDLLGRLG